MKKDIVYKIDLTIDAKGDIITAMCGCPAGAGPSGCCKYISALCYALEEFCRIKELRSPQSCTAELQRWNQPRKRRLDCRNVEDRHFICEMRVFLKPPVHHLLFPPHHQLYINTYLNSFSLYLSLLISQIYPRQD